MKANSLILSSSELEAIKLEAQKIQERLTVLETANPPANPEADGTYSFEAKPFSQKEVDTLKGRIDAMIKQAEAAIDHLKACKAYYECAAKAAAKAAEAAQKAFIEAQGTLDN